MPRESGILANERVPAGGGELVSFMSDPNTRVLGAGAGPSDKTSSSLAALRVDTLADVLVRERPGAARRRTAHPDP